LLLLLVLLFQASSSANTGQDNMTSTYKRLDQINPDLFRSLILGSDDSQPEQGQAGIMAPRPRPEGLGIRDIDTTPALEDTLLAEVARGMGRSAIDRERVANAVVPAMPVDPTAEMENPWFSLVPIADFLTRDKTEEAIPTLASSRNATPPLQMPLTGVDFTAGAQPVRETPVASTGWDATSFTRDVLGRFEGTEAHASLEGGADTAAYGVKYSLGLNREDYDSDLAFAAAVAEKHYDSVDSTFSSEGRNLSDLPTSVQNAIVDLHYNVGSIGSTAERESPVDMMKNTLDFIGVTTNDGTRGSLIALARRRAENWNNAAADLGVSRIASIEQIPRDGGTEFRYLDADGNVVHSSTSNRKPITFTGGTSYRVNTQTRRVEIE
jgi:hypothetical protein